MPAPTIQASAQLRVTDGILLCQTVSRAGHRRGSKESCGIENYGNHVVRRRACPTAAIIAPFGRSRWAYTLLPIDEAQERNGCGHTQSNRSKTILCTRKWKPRT